MKPDLLTQAHAARWQWDAPTLAVTGGFVVMTAIAVVQFLRAAAHFEQLFKELGVAVPLLTQVILSEWVHVVCGLALMVPLILRHRVAWKPWATTGWILGILTYIACSHAGLFEPLLRLIEQLGAQPSG
jgi:hypothetical protein